MPIHATGAYEQQIGAAAGGCTTWLRTGSSGTSGGACGGTALSLLYIDQASADPGKLDTCYTDSGCSTTTFSGGNSWYGIDEGDGVIWAIQIDNSGVIQDVVSC